MEIIRPTSDDLWDLGEELFHSLSLSFFIYKSTGRLTLKTEESISDRVWKGHFSAWLFGELLL